MVEALAPAEQRGTLEVSDRVVLAIARAAALGVSGVAPATATRTVLSGAVGRDLPRASAEVAGHRARVQVEVASLWPHPVAAVAAQVRDAVAHQLQDLAGVTADSVAVTVDTVVRLPGRQDDAGRGRVR